MSKSHPPNGDAVVWFECDRYDVPGDNGTWIVSVEHDGQVMKTIPICVADGLTGIAQMAGGLDSALAELPVGIYTLQAGKGTALSRPKTIRIAE